MSPVGHPCALVVHGSSGCAWNCDVCQSVNSAGTVRLGCGSGHDYDECIDCFKKSASFSKQHCIHCMGQSGACGCKHGCPTTASAHCTQMSPPGHSCALVFHALNVQQFVCDVCLYPKSEGTSHLRCVEHDYMECIDCFKKSKSTAVGGPTRTCSGPGSSGPASAADTSTPNACTKLPGFTTEMMQQSLRFLDARGEPTDTFKQYADAFFDALDQAVEPKGTGRIEACKFLAWMATCRCTGTSKYAKVMAMLPPDQWVAFYLVCGIESYSMPVRPKQQRCGSWPEQVAFTRAGWYQYLLNDMLCDPSGTYVTLMIAAYEFEVNLPLHRSMLPAFPDPKEVAQHDPRCQMLNQMVQQQQQRQQQQQQQQKAANGVSQHTIDMMTAMAAFNMSTSNLAWSW